MNWVGSTASSAAIGFVRLSITWDNSFACPMLNSRPVL